MKGWVLCCYIMEELGSQDTALDHKPLRLLADRVVTIRLSHGQITTPCSQAKLRKTKPGFAESVRFCRISPDSDSFAHGLDGLGLGFIFFCS